jgi:hypothetical protein
LRILARDQPPLSHLVAHNLASDFVVHQSSTSFDPPVLTVGASVELVPAEGVRVLSRAIWFRVLRRSASTTTGYELNAAALSDLQTCINSNTNATTPKGATSA